MIVTLAALILCLVRKRETTQHDTILEVAPKVPTEVKVEITGFFVVIYNWRRYKSITH